jgi:polysaccharide deacetylase
VCTRCVPAKIDIIPFRRSNGIQVQRVIRLRAKSGGYLSCDHVVAQADRYSRARTTLPSRTSQTMAAGMSKGRPNSGVRQGRLDGRAGRHPSGGCRDDGGAHTWDHHRADRYSGSDWKIQLNQPAAWLEKLTGTVVHFTYPYGSWNRRDFPHFAAAGCRTAFRLRQFPMDRMHRCIRCAPDHRRST